MQVSLALSGGAARGAFHLGVIEALQEQGIRIGAISGTSIGAVIAVGIGSGVTPKQMLSCFKAKAFKRIFGFHTFHKGWLSIKEEAAILRELAPISRLEAMHIPTFITCVDAITGKVLRFSQGESIALAIASCALTPLFRPVPYEHYLLIDGGFVDNLPIAPLLGYPYPIVSVDLFPLHVSTSSTFFALFKRALYLCFIASSQAQKDNSALYITDETLSSFSLFHFKDLDACFDVGYKRGKEAILTFLAQTSIIKG